MNLIITPVYKDFFDEPTPSLNDLLYDVPNSLIIKLTSAINGELYIRNSFESQCKIFDFLLNRQSGQIKQILNLKLREFIASNGNVVLYSRHLCIELLHQMLIRDNHPIEIEDTTIEQELRIFKAFILIAENEGGKIVIPEYSNSPMDFLRKSAWPSLVNQFAMNTSINYLNEIIKAKCFFDYLQFESDYSEFVDHFLEQHNVQNSFTYVYNLAALLTVINTDKSTNFKPRQVDVSDPSIRKIFIDLSINTNLYREKYDKEKKNYLGIKSHPLYQISEETFVVIDVNFFSKRIYNGLLYDFYEKTEICKKSEFKSFMNFKAYIGKNSIENYLFRKILYGCFQSKYIVKRFDDGSIEGFPDAYIRNGNKIFLFEIKDAYFDSKAIDSLSINEILHEIDRKFNNPKKGTGQLMKSIQKLAEKPFEDRTYDELKLKKRNIEVYPILVYTDDIYGLPGVGYYLDEKFKERYSELESFGFKKIMNLTFLNITFLMENVDLFVNKKICLNDVITSHHKEIKKREKILVKNIGDEKLVGPINATLEATFQDLYGFDFKRQEYLETIFRILDLKLGL